VWKPAASVRCFRSVEVSLPTTNRISFTASRDGTRVYAAVLGPLPVGGITLVGVGPAPGGVRLLGSPVALDSTLDGSDLHIVLPGAPPRSPCRCSSS
jgi:hypothetical protein